MTRSILIIIYYYAPMLSARAFRWSALAERWAAQGYHVDVVAAREGELAAQEQINGVTVYRVNSPIFEAVRSRLVRSHAAVVQTAVPASRPTILSKLLSAARWIYYHIFVNFYWPDAAFLWRGPAVRKALELASQHTYDVVIGVSPAFSGQLVAEEVFRRSGIPRLLCDFGDPFSIQYVQAHNNTKLYRRLNERVERRVLDRAHAISVTTQPTRDLYVQNFPAVADKITVIPPLLSLEPEPDTSTNQPHDDHLRLLFAGTFYSETRPPDFLLKLLARLLDDPEWRDRLELHVYGSVGTAREAFERFHYLIEEGKLVMHGLVDRNEVTKAMSEADVLVNVGNKTYYQLPSKVIEYAAMGKPILNIIQIENDSSRAAYASYPAVLNLLDEGDSAFESQLAQLRGWLTNLPERVDPVVLGAFLAEYRIDAVGRAYDALIMQRAERQ